MTKGISPLLSVCEVCRCWYLDGTVEGCRRVEQRDVRPEMRLRWPDWMSLWTVETARPPPAEPPAIMYLLVSALRSEARS